MLASLLLENNICINKELLYKTILENAFTINKKILNIFKYYVIT